MWQDERSLEPEILDSSPPTYTLEEYHRCLRLLGRINRVLGGYASSRRAFCGLSEPPSSILEVGCGGGYLCGELRHLFPEAQILGIDINPQAIQFAQERLADPSIQFEVQKNLSLDFAEGSFDVVTTILVCHHMTDGQFVSFIQQSHRVCRQAVILNDLHRHLLAYLGFSLVAPILFPSRLVWHDGRLSVRRSFRRADWVRLINLAGFSPSQYTLKWHPLFRWTLTLRKHAQ